MDLKNSRIFEEALDKMFPSDTNLKRRKALCAWRDLLLPGVAPYCERDLYESDIHVDFSKDALIFEFYNFKTRKLVRREMVMTDKTRDNWEPAKFKALLEEMKKEVLGE